MPSFLSTLAEEFLLPGMRNEKAIRKQMNRLVDLGVGIIGETEQDRSSKTKYWFLPIGEVKEMDRLRIALFTLPSLASEFIGDYMPKGEGKAHFEISGRTNTMRAYTSYIHGEQAATKLAANLISLKSFRAERLQLLKHMKAIEDKITSVKDLFPSSFRTSSVYASKTKDTTLARAIAGDRTGSYDEFFEEWQSQNLTNKRNLVKLVLHYEGDNNHLRDFVQKVTALPGSEDVLVGMLLQGMPMEDIETAAGLPGTYLRKISNLKPHMLDFDYDFTKKQAVTNENVSRSAAVRASMY